MSKISRNKIFLLGVVCALVMCISGIYAFSNITILTIKNDVNTGAVNIGLQEYTMVEENEELFNDSDADGILPGQVISLIPRITNSGDSCYVRVTVKYVDENNIERTLDQRNVDNPDEKWVNKGNYWYYKEALKPGDEVDAFKNLTIPSDISNEMQGKYLQVSVIAEAVQADNFSPDFTSELPWKNVTIEKATDDTYKTDKVQLNSNVKIEYENNAELYMNVPDNFFSRLGHILPGDTLKEDVTLNNTTSDEVEYSVSTEKIDGSTNEEIDLLKKLNLKITDGSTVLYEGSLYPLDNISLGKLNSNASSNLKFAIIVPSELSNQYSNINTGMKWHFSISGKDAVIPDDPKPVPSPQTGDTKVQIAFTLFFVSAISLVIIFIVGRRMNKNN